MSPLIHRRRTYGSTTNNEERFAYPERATAGAGPALSGWLFPLSAWFCIMLIFGKLGNYCNYRTQFAKTRFNEIANLITQLGCLFFILSIYVNGTNHLCKWNRSQRTARLRFFLLDEGIGQLCRIGCQPLTKECDVYT